MQQRLERLRTTATITVGAATITTITVGRAIITTAKTTTAKRTAQTTVGTIFIIIIIIIIIIVVGTATAIMIITVRVMKRTEMIVSILMNTMLVKTMMMGGGNHLW